MDTLKTHFFIIGAGIWGCVLAERIASVLRQPVVIVEKRPHIGGNCWSSLDEDTGIECHRYGSHIFHTSIRAVWDYITQFTSFTSYQHKVFTMHGGKVYSMPINLGTINAFYGKNFSPSEAEAFLQSEIARDRIEEPANLEEKAISLIGRPMYEAFIKGYTAKQWECDPRQLSSSIISRLPFRSNYNANYFNDVWQGVPEDGYSGLFKKLLNDPLITIKLNTSYQEIREQLPSDAIVFYTGMPDTLFDYALGPLEWRSLRFEWETKGMCDYQGTAVMNFADEDVPYTRVHEFKHYHPERNVPYNLDKTVICREYSQTWKTGSEPYYPVNNERNNALYAQYAQLAEKSGIFLGGRLGAYRYWDMDKAIANALETFAAKFTRNGIA